MKRKLSFGATNSPHGNVVFNFTDRPITDLVAFGTGYRRAGRSLAESLAASNGYLDYDAYPIFFIYRHAIELYLKAAIIKAGQLAGALDVAGADTSKLFTYHQLVRLYDVLNPILRSSLPDDTAGAEGEFHNVRAFLEDIEAVDKESDAFRYPIDTAGGLSHPKHLILNVLTFAEKAEHALDLLDAIIMSITVAFDRRTEVRAAIDKLLREVDATA